MMEVDFLPVGDHGRSGDAIAIRLTEPRTLATRIILVDAGFSGAGEALVEHVERYFGGASVDLLISSHPHQDHTGGLADVFAGLTVRKLWAHNPAAHGAGSDIASAGSDIYDLARSYGVGVVEPFAGLTAFDDTIMVLGPSVAFYEEMVLQQRQTAMSKTLLEAASRGGVAVAARSRTLLYMPEETLVDDSGGTDPVNNTSVILGLKLGTEHVLLTADAGVPALHAAHDFSLQQRGGHPYTHVQVPHHGSRHNVDPDILDEILGPKTDWPRGGAIASVAVEADGHPRASVANAFARRGFPVCPTKGATIGWHFDAPPRVGWGPVAPLGPLDESED
jgi:beta-lactamase superfamily II metal-dependent hydrolase